jgi:hypothetical protein
VAPDIVFGNLTITQVRAIDLTWNLAAGRGLQGLIGLTTYKVANAALLRLAETVPLSYRAFEVVSISRLSLSAVGPLAQAVLRTGGWRAKSTFVVLFLSAVFVLVLPTLNDVMTGYVQYSQLYWQLSNGTMGLASDIDTCCVDDSNCVKLAFCYNGTIIPTLCVPETGYQWGFSAIWMYVVCSMTFFWAWGMFGLWVDADRFSTLYRSGRRMNIWRAITDLGSALEQDVGPDLSTYSTAELEKEVDAAPPVMYTIKRRSEGGLDGLVLSSKTTNS